MTAREPTEAMRETARDITYRAFFGIESGAEWGRSQGIDDDKESYTQTPARFIDIIARALMEQDAAARREGFEQAKEMAARTAEEAPSNINSHWEWDAPTPGEIARAIRALTPEPPSEKENEGG